MSAAIRGALRRSSSLPCRLQFRKQPGLSNSSLPPSDLVGLVVRLAGRRRSGKARPFGFILSSDIRCAETRLLGRFGPLVRSRPASRLKPRLPAGSPSLRRRPRRRTTAVATALALSFLHNALLLWEHDAIFGL